MESEEHMRKIRSVMSRKILMVKETDSIIDVSRIMSNKSYSCVIVQKGHKPVGIVSERDIIKKLVAQKKNLEGITVKGVMSTDLITVPDDADLVPTGRLMKKRNVRRFPVVNKKGNLVGLVTQTDIVEGILKLVKHMDWELVTMKISVEEYLDKLREHKILQ